jgi:hypothetical protein
MLGLSMGQYIHAPAKGWISDWAGIVKTVLSIILSLRITYLALADGANESGYWTRYAVVFVIIFIVSRWLLNTSLFRYVFLICVLGISMIFFSLFTGEESILPFILGIVVVLILNPWLKNTQLFATVFCPSCGKAGGYTKVTTSSVFVRQENRTSYDERLKIDRTYPFNIVNCEYTHNCTKCNQTWTTSAQESYRA